MSLYRKTFSIVPYVINRSFTDSMRNQIFIQVLALVLCFAMVGEVTVLVENIDAISLEVDGEAEHEENKEKEKEKTTEGFDSIMLSNDSLISQSSFATYQFRNWNTPSIDFQTPPPELT